MLCSGIDPKDSMGLITDSGESLKAHPLPKMVELSDKPMQKDMDDLSWEIPVDQILMVLEWVSLRSKGVRNEV